MTSSSYTSTSSSVESRTDTSVYPEGPTSKITQEQITHFSDDSAIAKVAKPVVEHPEAMIAAGQELRKHEIIDFLQRPVEEAQYTVDATQPVGHLVAELTYPNQWYTHFMLVEKLNGFRLIRAGIHFRILLSGSPMDTGRWFAVWLPYEQGAGSYAALPELPNLTAYPIVEIELGQGTSAELTVPYISPYTHVDQVNNTGAIGVFRIYTMTPLQSTVTGNDAVFTVYSQLTDVSLDIPVDLSWVPLPPMVAAAKLPRRYAQGGGEQEDRSKANVTSGMSGMASKAASVLHQTMHSDPPVKKLGWVGEAVAGVAALMGLSKPTSVGAITSIVNTPMQGFTHGDDLDRGVTLSTISNNGVTTDARVFSSGVDEMDVSYVCAKSAWFSSFTWQTNTAPLTALFTIPVTPCRTGDVAGLPPNEYATTPLSFVASMFRYWRGGVRYRLSMVKNSFYRGRLGIIFIPGATPSAVSLATLDQNACSRWVVDVSERGELEFTIPYAAPNQWLQTKLVNAGDEATLDYNYSLGSLIFYVINPLRAIDTVPDTITVNMWIAGSTDTQFATPDMVQYYPVRGQTAASLKKGKRVSGGVRKAQGFTNMEDTFSHMNQLSAGVQTSTNNAMLETNSSRSMFPSEHCIGEAVVNLRVLTRRATRILPANLRSNGYQLDGAWFGDLTDRTMMGCPLFYIANMYRFYRGGRRWKFTIKTYPVGQLDPTTTATRLQFTANSLQTVTTSPIDPRGLPSGNSPTAGEFAHITFTDINETCEFECPFYSNVPLQLVSDSYPAGTASRMVYSFVEQVLEPSTGGWAAPEFDVYTAAADDFSFGCLIGTPHVVQVS